MTTLALDSERRPILGAGPRRGSEPRRRAHPEAGRRTLDDVIAGAWRELTGARSAGCPVCAGRMEPRYGAGAVAVGGRCQDCGSTLG